MPKKVINYQSPHTDESLLDYLAGTSLETAVCWKLTPRNPVRGLKPVTWQNVVGLSSAAGALGCAGTGSNDWGSHGASSVETFAETGKLRFRRGHPTGRFAVGLSSDDGSRHYNDIDFAWLVDTPNGQAQIVEGGTVVATYALPHAAAVYGVERVWDYTLNRYRVDYTVDGEVKRASAATPAATLRVDTAFSAFVAGAVADVELTQSITSVGATSYTEDLVLPGHAGVTFKRSRGGVPTLVDVESGHESAGLQVESVFDDDCITEETVDAGDWYRAKFEIFTVNVLALGMGQLVEFSGKIGNIVTEGPRFEAEARPLTAIAQAAVGKIVTAKSQTRLGDARCGLNTALGQVAADGGAMRIQSTTTHATGATKFRDTARTEAADYFGEVVFLTGPLWGRSYEVRSFDAATKEFTLREAAHLNIPVGVTYQAIRRCDQTLRMCRDVYNNVINSTMDPFITNVEEINRIDRAA